MATLTGSSSCRPSCDLRHIPSGFSLPRQGLPFPRRSSSTGRTILKREASSFCVKAMEISGPGSIESTLMVSMSEKLKEQLNTSDVVVKDAYGDGRHVSIEVVSPEFEGKSSVNRQRMVYKAIWEELQSTVHAVDSMRTLTPDEASVERSKPSS